MDNRCDGTALGNARRRDAGSSVRLDTLQKASLRSVSSRLPDQKDALTTKQQALRVVVDRRASEHGGGEEGVAWTPPGESNSSPLRRTQAVGCRYAEVTSSDEITSTPS